jgi:hypothetical protein
LLFDFADLLKNRDLARGGVLYVRGIRHLGYDAAGVGLDDALFERADRGG